MKEEHTMNWTGEELDIIKGKLLERGYLTYVDSKPFYCGIVKIIGGKSARTPTREITDMQSFLVWQAMMMSTGTPYFQRYNPNTKETTCYFRDYFQDQISHLKELKK